MQITRRRGVVFGAALLGVVVVVAGIALAVRRSQPTAPAPVSVDAQVCAHVDPAPHLLAPGGDWNTPYVAAIAYRASPYVRDAYSAAAEAQIPFQATPEQMQAVTRAWTHLSDVCAAVRAQQ